MISEYDKKKMTAFDLADAQRINNEMNGGTIGTNDAHLAMEALRSKYGYSGGASGNEYLPVAPAENGIYGGTGEGIGNGTQRTAGGSGRSTLDSLVSEYVNRKPFTYDPENDAIFKQYREQYGRGAKAAANNTLAQVAARTGGLASSYATQVSQQTYNDFMGKLSDKLPEMYDRARAEYDAESQRLLSDISLLRDIENQEYQRGMTAEQLAYQRAQNAEAQRLNAENTAYQRGLQKAQTLGGYGDFSGYGDVGYTPEQVAAMKSGYDAQQALALQKATKSNGGGSGGSNTVKPALTYAQMNDAIDGGKMTSGIIEAAAYYEYGGDIVNAIIGVAQESEADESTVKRIVDEYRRWGMTDEEAMYIYDTLGIGYGKNYYKEPASVVAERKAKAEAYRNGIKPKSQKKED